MSKRLIAILWVIGFSALITLPLFAQRSDTVEIARERKLQEYSFQSYHTDRAVGNMMMPQTGKFSVPEPKKYYVHPFMGQQYLEAALQHYYKKWDAQKSLLFRFINAIAPYINNGFEFAVYRIYDLPIVERNNPLLDPQLNAKQQSRKY